MICTSWPATSGRFAVTGPGKVVAPIVTEPVPTVVTCVVGEPVHRIA